ncbi:MAG: hypothetical protein H7177_07255 [Rhizobacter sp.]|nr:hypothetical protein [Bacteriovorax sp.]
MKTSLLIFALIINSSLPVLMAADISKVNLSTSMDVFKSKWSFTPLLIKTEGESKVHTKMFKRQMWIESTPVDIADTTFVYLENPKKDEDPKKNELSYIAQAMKKSFGKDMKVTGSGSDYNVEGKFEKINRYIKVNLVKKDNYVLIITTFARLGLYNKLQSEIEELHETLATYNGKLSTPPKTSWYKSLFVSDAQAAGLDLSSIFGGSNTNTGSGLGGLSYNLTGNFTDLTNSVNGLNNNVTKFNTSLDNTNMQMGTANTNWAGTNTQLGGFNTNWAGTNAQIGAANTNWANTNVQLGNANTNWAASNAQADKLNTNLAVSNQNWADTNAEAAKANATAAKFADEAKGMNTNWAESNKILAQAMDPNHMAKVAFYTAAGAALGGVAVNLAIQGVSEGIGFLVEMFTGAKKKKLEWDDFEKAMNAWDNQLNDLVKMEQAVDNYLAAFDFFEGKNLGNDYVKQLQVATRDMRFDRDMFMEKFKNQNMDVSCRKVYYDAADELDQKVKEYDKIIMFATNNNMSIKNQGANYFCSQLKELQRKILGAETQMQDLRLKILVAENQYYGKQSDELDKRDKDIDKVNDRIKDTLAEKKLYDDKVMERVKEAHKQTKNDWLSACMDGKNEQGLAIKEELSKTFALIAYFKKKSRCSDAFAGVEETLKKRDEDAVRRIASEDELRKTLVVKSNNTVEMKLSEEQMSWMSRVHMDAYCYQFAHGDAAKMPKKCSEFPELLYSMSLSKGYEKAKRAYDNKCEDRYLSGLKSLASQK